nr:hypothetical protein [Streptomyces tsukubensis NRRL18488]
MYWAESTRRQAPFGTGAVAHNAADDTVNTALREIAESLRRLRAPRERRDSPAVPNTVTTYP